MILNRRMNLFAVLLVVIALFTSCFVTNAQAAGGTNQETVEVVGNDLENPLLPEMNVDVDHKTALDALVNAVGSSNLETSESAYGKMITGINGLKAKDTFYWAFYINGFSAQVGADQYIVQDGDHLSFRYVDYTVSPEKTVSIKVSGKKEVMKEVADISYINEPTAFQLLQVLWGDKVAFSDTQFGKMITSINGLAGEGTNYWAFYVNGQMATVGADSYKLQAGDQISFQYESWEKQEDGTNKDNNTTPGVAISNKALQKAINLTSEYILKNQVSEWDAIALKQTGKTLPKTYLDNVTKVIKDKNGHFSKITDYERYTLGILAAGGNPTDVAGVNLVEKIYNGDVTKQGLNGVAYALIAIDSANFKIPNNAKWPREKLVNQLLEKQNKDGGWSWDGSATSDIDTTAMVITAIAPYKNEAKTKETIEAAIEFLSTQYLAGKVDNSSTASQLVVALSSLGINANGTAFTKDGVSLIAYLLTYQNVDGGFDWQGGNSSDVFSTSQAYQAIVAFQLFQNGKGSLYNLPLNPVKAVPNTQKKESSNENKTTSDSEKVQDGKPLPNTATNQYNLLAFGLLLLLAGTVFYMIEKRKKA
ncbi:DUF4430 domain-containing protein [Neobacillus sp. D3-1R]|uniref:DUF4430 domain-containing protein n=1 Tax=Neobacillus sp. D3-1R TaxID=3445778 RepID=UPI003FA14004